MKSKFIQVGYALILPVAFIVILIMFNTLSFVTLSKYGFGGVLVTLIALLLTLIAVKLDRKTFKDIGFYFDKKTPIRFLVGFLIGTCIAVMMYFIVINFSDITISANKESNISAILLWLLAFFSTCLYGRDYFRGYAFTKTINSIGIWPAQIILAILFAWYHDFTGATFFQQLWGPGIWAFVYGIAAIWSKGIALPTGLHMALNVIIALVGEKDGKEGIWRLEYATEITPAMKMQTENIGLILQFCILIMAIGFTQFYRRKKSFSN